MLFFDSAQRVISRDSIASINNHDQLYSIQHAVLCDGYVTVWDQLLEIENAHSRMVSNRWRAAFRATIAPFLWARAGTGSVARFNPNLGQQSGLVPALAAGLLLVVLEDLGCIVDNPIRLKLLNDCIQLTRERAIKILQGGYELLVRGPLLY